MIDELEQIHLEDETVFELGLRAQQFLFGEPVSYAFVNSIEYHNAAQVDESCRGGGDQQGVGIDLVVLVDGQRSQK